MFKPPSCGRLHESVNKFKLAPRSKQGPISSYMLSSGLITQDLIDSEDQLDLLNWQHITDTTVGPWMMICSIESVFADGASYRGTGWFAGPQTVVTSAHNIVKPRYGKASVCHVTPGLADPPGPQLHSPFGSFESTEFMLLDEWTSTYSAEFDYAAIQLDTAPIGDNTFGIEDSATEGSIANVAGYPMNQGGGKLFHSFDEIAKVLEHVVLYKMDTDNGQSGSPVYVIGDDGKPYVQAIHGYGTDGLLVRELGITANYGPRMTSSVIAKINEWIDAA